MFDVTNGLSKSREAFGFGYPFLTFKEIFNSYFVPDELVNLANTTEAERKKCSIKRGDVFITRTSETFDELGITCVALKDYPNATFNGFTKRLRPNGKVKINPEYSSFYFKNASFRRQVLSLTNMTTRASLNNEMLERLTIVLPPMEKQKEIAKILVDCHNKIELNRQINQTLEQIAQAMFKSWFVDFEPTRAKIAAKEAGGDQAAIEQAAMCAISGKTSDQLNQSPPETLAQLKATAALFPDALVDSELGEIPEGWEVSEIGKEVDVVGGGTPSTANVEFWDGGQHHWTTPKDLSNLTDKILLETDRKITDAGLAKISSGLLPQNTVLMSSRAPVGYLAIAKIPVAINQGYIAMKCEKILSPEYVVQWAESVMDEIKQRSSGTTFAEISKTNFRLIRVLVPSKDLIQAYTKDTSKFYETITSLLLENLTLVSMRDSLLPRLLSGGTIFGVNDE
ncbi:restriction endonuclease subunit S [Undibacterium baiyunense]|uniref:restriction endonuclease subunit S n=1 Tax=Undibacterium baiyunense TaxID=2828731 RepID=UPI002E2F24D8|nr:restriction endonuclease subunit S [Undibacterium baiyunense]